VDLVRLKIGVAVAALLLGVLLAPTARATGPLVVRPGSLQGWSPNDGSSTNGRWVKGPATAPLGVGSALLRESSGDALHYYYSGYPSLSNYVASYKSYGSTPAAFVILTDAALGPGKYQELDFAPSGSSGWNSFGPTGASTWHWDCDGDGSFEGSGSIADFRTVCNSGARVESIVILENGGTTYVDDVVLGPSGSTTTYDMEPPTVTIHNVKMEGDSGTSPMKFKVSLSGKDDAAVRFFFKTINGTATAGEDYKTTRGRMTIPAGSPYGVIKVPVIGDRTHEQNEKFSVWIRRLHNAAVGDVGATGTIVNDD